MDEIDHAIVSQLQYDGRLPFTRIAEGLGITEGAVRRRVKQMIDDGKLQIVGVVDPQELGWTEASLIGITVQPDLIEEVADVIAQLPEVTYLFQAVGEFDLFAEVYCQDKEHYVSFLNQTLHKISGVERTRSYLILKMYKLSYRWGQAEPPQAGRIFAGVSSDPKPNP
ncbi:MAG: Lrp/AsnC family transcriptional regulator [Anaerolineales bacterium]